MKQLPFYIVDVFAERKYAGNQLAVILDTDRTLASEQMQQLALEMNYSETTFILSDKPLNSGYDVRIFTPGEEVPFAGHPTLGTAHIIQQTLIKQHVEKVVLNLKVGQIPVTFHADEGQSGILWMQQIAPTFGEVLDTETIANILGLKIDDFDSRFPIQEVSTGLPFIITPIKTLESLQRISVDKDDYFTFVDGRWAQAILAFCPESHEDGGNVESWWWWRSS